MCNGTASAQQWLVLIVMIRAIVSILQGPAVKRSQIRVVMMEHAASAYVRNLPNVVNWPGMSNVLRNRSLVVWRIVLVQTLIRPAVRLIRQRVVRIPAVKGVCVTRRPIVVRLHGMVSA